ncbi:MAG TPA: PP2C family protein-serine/threonine phosphatase [Candidatus Limnocylindrales bacterium]|jgi:sigma-B regulation protein RsbU (phosphoserine phosphatase)|nr:PP2C family protein-serine/threonine phosphatase [Candidatus Limnocylindrales bacterium]
MKAVQNIEAGGALVESLSPGLVPAVGLEATVSVTLPSATVGVDSDLANELAVARAIQLSLLPKAFPKLPGFGLAGFCQSARQVGGDFYDALPLSDTRALLVIADVMGKGVPAALFAASLRVLVRSFLERKLPPHELLRRINRQMYEELSSVDMFITAQFVEIDTARRLLRVANAGHCPLLLCNGLGPTREIAPHGLPLGINMRAEFVEQTVALEPGDCALLYTDGLTEACNAFGLPFGQERLSTWLGQNAGGSRSASQLREDFLTAFKTFQGDTPPRDDLTLLLAAEEPTPDSPVIQSIEPASLAE